MGSERFQSEYIEYLQGRNAELLNRLAKMKEIYENKIFSNDLNQHYFISTLVDVINVCAAMPEEIDMLFDKMSEAMSVLINVLSRKSALIQLGEKISKLLNKSNNRDVIDVQSAEEDNNSKINRKAGTVKVSPMINGHIISTEPRICLSRVSGDYIPNRSDGHCLSPILEVSPDVTSDSPDVKDYNLKELRVISERLNLNHATYNCISQESPKGRFKGTKIWKKSLSSNQQAQNKKDSHLLQNNENLEKPDAGGTAQPQSSENDIDPMEGPSWLYDNKETNSSSKCFIDVRRRRHRYARVFGKDKDDITFFKNKEVKVETTYKNTSSGESCNECDNAEGLKSISSESSLSLLESDEEYTPCSKKLKSLRKRKKCNYKENCDSDGAPTRSSRRLSNKKEKKDSDMSDSYEGDNEENSSGKCKTTRKLCKSNSSKSSVVLESLKSLPRESSEELNRCDRQERQISLKPNKQCLKPMSYDINFLIKDALGREALIPIEDCMKGKENKKKEKLSQIMPNTSRSKDRTKSSTIHPSEEKKITEISIGSSSCNQNQRLRRKVAPTNLTEPRLGTKLRRS